MVMAAAAVGGAGFARVLGRVGGAWMGKTPGAGRYAATLGGSWGMGQCRAQAAGSAGGGVAQYGGGARLWGWSWLAAVHRP